VRPKIIADMLLTAVGLFISLPRADVHVVLVFFGDGQFCTTARAWQYERTIF
jgi:hypothetical protein